MSRVNRERPYDDPWGAWRDDANCPEIGGDVWFPDDQMGLRRQAYEICDSCPVKKLCFEYAVTTPDISAGIWGGVAMAEVRAERKRRNIEEKSTDEMVDAIVASIMKDHDEDSGEW